MSTPARHFLPKADAVGLPAHLPPQPEHPDWPQWKAMAYAPMDGTEVLLLVRHNNHRFAAAADQAQWQFTIRARWVGSGCWAWVDLWLHQPITDDIAGWRHWGTRRRTASVHTPAAPRPEPQEQR